MEAIDRQLYRMVALALGFGTGLAATSPLGVPLEMAFGARRRRREHNGVGRALLGTAAVCLALGPLFAFVPEAVASEGTARNLPWETPLQTLQASLTGPVAMAISVIAVAVAGGALVFGGEMSDFTRRMVMIVFAVAILMTASGFVENVFTEGALV